MTNEDVMNRLVTYSMLGKMLRERDRITEPTLELVKDGWQIRLPDREHPIPINVVDAYEASSFDQQVLDETRKYCGKLRLRKRDAEAQEMLTRLRYELTKARELKATRQQ